MKVVGLNSSHKTCARPDEADRNAGGVRGLGLLWCCTTSGLSAKTLICVPERSVTEQRACPRRNVAAERYSSSSPKKTGNTLLRAQQPLWAAQQPLGPLSNRRGPLSNRRGPLSSRRGAQQPSGAARRGLLSNRRDRSATVGSR
eukprot:gene12122-biopygen18455